MTRMKNRSGMTLIELMIGLVIMSAAVAAGYATFSSIVDQRQRMKTFVDDVSRGANIRRTLSTWLESGFIIMSSGAAPRNGLQIGSGAARDELQFLTRAKTPLESDLTKVALYVNNSNAAVPPGLVAEFVGLGGITQEPVVISIDPTVSAIRVEYLVNQDGGIRRWSTADEGLQPGIPPVAVRISFVSRDMLSLTTLLRIPLTVVLPASI